MIHKNIKVKLTEKTGKGLFAENIIKKGEVVLIFEGEPVKSVDLPKDIDLGDLFPTGVDSYLIVHDPELLINHSCNPNAGFSDDSILIAIRDIAPGEQVTFDYSTVGADGWEMDCLCGEKECRKRIKDFRFLSDDLKEKYDSLTPDWVKSSQIR